eukprot:226819_1
MSHPTIAHRMEPPKEEKHGTKLRPNHRILPCKRRGSTSQRRNCDKKGKSHQKAYRQRKAMQFNGQIGQCAWIHHHTQRDAKSLELVTPSRQHSKPRETANKDRDQRIQNTGGITRRAFKAEEPNGPPKAEDLCGFHGDSMAMTKQFPLQSMIHLNEPIVKQREKEKHELRSETTRKEECLRNI